MSEVHMKGNMKTFGLTGNIGTGKSTVSWMFEEMGVAVIDSDELAHEAIAPHSRAAKAIFERYGKAVMQRDGAIDRKALANIVFRDQSERKFLESIIHPHVKAEIEHRVAKLARQGTKSVIVEVPLLYEVGWEDDFDAVIVVRCDEKEEIRRCREKFGMSPDEAKLRLSAQMPIERKAKKAHAVIDNSGPIEETKVQVRRLYQEMVKGSFPRHRSG